MNTWAAIFPPQRTYGGTFRCGHKRTPSNSYPVGKYWTRCRECHKQRVLEDKRKRREFYLANGTLLKDQIRP
jgi:hypothetical protein